MTWLILPCNIAKKRLIKDQKMCGIAGVFSAKLASNKSDFQTLLHSMGQSLNHRGPDDSQTWIHSDIPLGFVHQRLAVQDLSKHGAQPMNSSSKRYTIVFNGEIYNFKKLRQELEKQNCVFRGNSDTEVLLTCIELWGLNETLKKCKGMFAFALWDHLEKQLILCRDRLGQKPLYYGWDRGQFIFSSELKPIMKIPSFSKNIDQTALSLYFKYNCIPTPYSIYQGIYKLNPGSYIVLTEENLINRDQFCPFNSPQLYWKAINCFDQKSYLNLEKLSENQVRDELESRITEVISEQMQPDVPYGAFLSGGVDSSLVVAIMQNISASPNKTFSIGFNEKDYNEAGYAKEVARHLGTEHHELYVSGRDAIDIIPSIPHLYDEPFSDSSQIPTHIVSRLAKKDVTVCLSGDGGDELFAGYNRYRWTTKIFNKVSSIPNFMRRPFSHSGKIISPELFNQIYLILSNALPKNLRVKNPGNKYQKILNLFNSQTIEECYDSLISHWNISHQKLVLGDLAPRRLANFQNLPNEIDPVPLMMFKDITNYLMDDILVKVDRAAMGCSLETRIPLLDQRVVEYALSIPMSLKIKNNSQKYLLRQILYKYVPRELIERPKSGFGIPIGSMLKSDLKDWSMDLLDPAKIKNQGLLNNKLIQETWKKHQQGQGDFQYDLWDVLMFQSWYQTYH
ncbi:asparagine synthase (glutamine-hydrolyzing) [Bacteriovoracaceae bacterium]|nr:asparagine synthase (glutamine-hydrolyzing) [Bacteriovoracaceae bacterium]